MAHDRAASELWLSDTERRSWGQFGSAVEEAERKFISGGVLPGSIVVIPGDARFESLAWLFGAVAVGAVVAPLRQDRLRECNDWKQFITIGWQVQGNELKWIGEGATSESAEALLGELDRRRHAGLILATGGTTGTAKLVLHDLTGLLASVPIRQGPAWRTLPLMRFDHIGGLDTAWRALAGQQVLVEPPPEITPQAVAETVARHKVEVLPATPSFLNLLLLADADKNHDLTSLRIVPYGAESMPAGLLARLKSALPQVSFIERFGTSETGAIPVHGVGPGMMLRGGDSGYAWRIVDGALWIKSPVRALGYLDAHTFGLEGDGWYRTGDLAEEMASGAIRILGRQEETMNVGGEKVLPGEVEGMLLTHPLVADCRVRAEPNGILGQVVAADIVWSGPEKDSVTVKRMLHEFAAGLISPHKLPASVRLVEAVDSTKNLKKLRNFRS